jgi:hypothetical protein
MFGVRVVFFAVLCLLWIKWGLDLDIPWVAVLAPVWAYLSMWVSFVGIVWLTDWTTFRKDIKNVSGRDIRGNTS